MSAYLEIARRFVRGEDPEPTSAPTPEPEGEPSILKVTPPEKPTTSRRCFFCEATLPEKPLYVGPHGGAYLCRCGGWNYPETPSWVGELASRALEANRRRPVPPELSKRFSAAVLAGDEAAAYEVLAEIEAHAQGGE